MRNVQNCVRKGNIFKRGELTPVWIEQYYLTQLYSSNLPYFDDRFFAKYIL